MKTLLSLDLGVTTGWAVIDISNYNNAEKDVLLGHGMIRGDQIFEDELRYILLAHLPTHSVAERPIIFRGPLGVQLEERIRVTSVVLDHQVRFVNPSDWKDSKFKNFPVPRSISQHERDAIRIGVWYLNTQLPHLISL